jgi:hypothetical protein
LAKKFPGQNKTHAFRRAAVAGMFLVSFPIVAVVESDFLAGQNVAQGCDPNPPLKALRLAIGGATMIDKPCGVPVEIPVQIKLVVERKDEPVLPLTAPCGFLLGDFLAQILDDALTPAQNCFRENTQSMNG